MSCRAFTSIRKWYISKIDYIAKLSTMSKLITKKSPLLSELKLCRTLSATIVHSSPTKVEILRRICKKRLYILLYNTATLQSWTVTQSQTLPSDQSYYSNNQWSYNALHKILLSTALILLMQNSSGKHLCPSSNWYQPTNKPNHYILKPTPVAY